MILYCHLKQEYWEQHKLLCARFLDGPKDMATIIESRWGQELSLKCEIINSLFWSKVVPMMDQSLPPCSKDTIWHTNVRSWGSLCLALIQIHAISLLFGPRAPKLPKTAPYGPARGAVSRFPPSGIASKRSILRYFVRCPRSSTIHTAYDGLT